MSRLVITLLLVVTLPSPLFAGYAASPSSTTTGTDSSNATSSFLRLEVTSISNASNNVTFRVSKKDGTTFSTSGKMSIRLDCGGSACSVVTSGSVSAGATSKSFSIYMPAYVQGTVVKDFYGRYDSSNGYWSYAGPIAISAPSLATPGSTIVTEIATTSARLNWGSVTAAESYRYQVTSATSFATSGDGSVCSNCIANATTSAATQVITGLTSGTTYRWRVRAGNATTGQGSLWSSTSTFTTLAPAVASVTPTSAILGQVTTFTVAGTNLTAGMGFWIHECSGITEISGGSASSRQFRCTPSFSTGIKDGEVKTTPGGTLLRSFSVNVTAPLPTVSSVMPTSAILGQATTFTVAGANLTAGMGFWIHECSGITEISGGSASSRQFRCTPSFSTGTKAGEVKTAPGGTLLHSFSVSVIPLPTVTEVKPVNAILGEPTTFTIFGSGLTAGMGFWVHDCAGITEQSGGTATERQFRCTPDFTTGTKPGEVKTAPGGTLLHSFTVNAITSPSINSVTPLQVILGVSLTFTIDGTGLPAGMGFWVDDCAGVAELAGGTSTRRQFRCTPGDDAGVKSGEVKAASAGTLLRTFSVNVAAPTALPSVTGVTPSAATVGQATTFTVAGSNLPAGMGFWIDGCSGVAELAGGSGVSRQFRCTPGAAGQKAGEVKSAPGGDLLYQFSVAVAGSGIYVNVDPWAQAAADFMVRHGIVTDPPNHDLRGTSDIRRAELATMLYRALGGGLAEADARFAAWHGGLLRSPFVDAVDPTVWYYLSAAYLGNLTFGDGISVFDRPQGAFRPDGTISRAWAVKAILEAWDIPPLTSLQGVTLFTDVPASHPAAGYIYQAVQKGIATGTDGVFSPDTAADRQDLFVMLHRVLDASANARSLAVPSPAPLAPADFDDARAFAPRTLGSRYEQPVLAGVQAPTASINVIRSGLESVGALQGLYTVTFEAVISGIDSRTFTDAGGTSYQARPFCAWEAASGGLVDETPSGGIPFSRVKWIAPSDSSPAGGGTLEIFLTLRVGDGLGSEVTALRTLALTGRPASDPSLPLLTIDPLAAVQAGEIVEVTGSILDSGDSESPAFGDIEVYLSFSRNGGVSWIPVGRAALRADGQWDALWRVPEPAGPVVLRARAINVRGNQREVRVETTIGPLLAIQGIVVSTSLQPLPNARVTLSEGGVELASALTDAQGAFLFTTGGAEGLATGRSYTLTAVSGAQRATASGIVLTSGAPRAERTLTIGIDSTPPVTQASLPSGIYSAPFSVTLTCQDDSSGCATIYYTTNGSTPTTASSVYTAPLTVSAGLTLRFFGVDLRGNREEPRRRTYTFQACSFEATPAGVTFPRAGGTGEVTVRTGDDCVWRLESAAPWITVTASGEVRGPGSGGYTVAPNTGEASRSGSLTVSGRTVAITQAGVVSHTLTVVKGGNGSGAVFSSPAGLYCGNACSASFPESVQIALTAAPTSGSSFTGWSGDADCADGVVTMSAARSCTATFQLSTSLFTLSVDKAGSGSGRVTSLPPGIDCGLDCAEELSAGTQVALQAVPDAGSGPVVWSGDPDCADGRVTLLADRTCTANFEQEITCVSRWTSGGPYGGTVRQVWLDPSDPDHLYAAGSGGLYESLDGGGTWSSTGLGARSVNALAVDPATPSNLYAATDDSVLRSQDGGQTWTASRPSPGTGFVLALAIDPASPSTLWAGVSGEGLFRSTDAGATWSSVPLGVTGDTVNVIAIASTNPQILYLGMERSGVLKSTDGGTIWRVFNYGLGSLAIRSLVLDQRSSSLLVISTLGGVHRSTNGGETWESELTGGLMMVAQSPGEPWVFFATGTNGSIWRSLNSGDSWNWTSTVSNTGGILGITISPSEPATMYLVTQGRGVLKSTDRGRNFQELNAGLAHYQPSALIVEPAPPWDAYTSSLYVAELFKTTDAGAQWIPFARDFLQKPVLDVAVPARSDLYAVTLDGVFKSEDRGAHWSNVTGTLQGKFPHTLAASPSDPNVIYTIASGGLYRTLDGAQSWTPIGAGLGNVSRLKADPGNASKVLAQSLNPWPGQLYRSVDSGSTWSPAGNGLPVAQVSDFAFSPGQPGTIFAVSGFLVYKSVDSGGNWSVLGTLPVSAFSIAAHPSDPNILYAGMFGGGVYRSVDGGVSWSPWNSGLPALSVVGLVAVGTSPVIVYAATSGRGIFQISECPEYPLTVSLLGTGSGTVVSSPLGIECGASCLEPYPPGTWVALTAQAAVGSVFSGWSGEGCSGTGECRVLMSQARSVSATFTLQSAPPGPPNLLVNPSFAGDLAGWTSSGQGSAAWDAGSRQPGSGSVLLTNQGSTPEEVLGQCVPVSGDTPYRLEGWFSILGEGTPGFTFLRVNFYDQPSCGGNGIGGGTTTSGSNVAGPWHQLSTDVRSPQAAVSARLHLMLLESPAGGSMTVRFDDLSFTSTLLFKDGFESGDPSAWSFFPP